MEKISLRFKSKALDPNTFQILQFDGEEEISHLFRFELQLVSQDPDIDFKAVLESTAVLEITTQGHTRYIHGMLSEFEQGEEWHSGLIEYRAVLVPRLWMLTQSQQNQIFQKQNVTEIIENELGEFSHKGQHPLVNSGLSEQDYALSTLRDYDEREYVVQYKESDFNFISRLMEHEGIFYFFEHDEEREKVVITDAVEVAGVSEACAAEYHKDAATALYDRSVVYKLRRSQKQIPSTILMTDYNYRSPSLPMQAEDHVPVKEEDGIEGIGFVTEFGAHFKSPEEGAVLAAIRAEEFRCRQNIFSGESNIASFSCGALYSLAAHFRAAYNRDYLLTKVVHHGKQEIESWGKVGGTTYYNQFSCIPSGLQFRPQRLTPKPKMYGIMNGVIDSEQDMNRADLDEYGRYKVLMPFDISGAAPGKASRRIRMAQPYGGGGRGMSFPLLKGTEVIWTCIDGDIDRPIITGAVPNPLNPSVTTADNHSSNVIKTTSGITMSFHDGIGSSGQNVLGGGSGDLSAQQQFQNINPEILSPQNKQDHSSKSSEANTSLSPPDHVVQHSIEQQRQMMADEHKLKLSDVNSTHGTSGNVGSKQFSIGVPRYADGNKDSYLRLGKAAPWEVDQEGEDWAKDGWLEYTDGDHLSIVKGERITHTYEGESKTTEGEMFSYGLSDTYDYSLAHSFSSGMSLSGSAHTGFSIDTNVGVSVDMKFGCDFQFGIGKSFSFYDEGTTQVSKENTTEVDQRFVVKVDPVNGIKLDDLMKYKIPKIAAGLALASTAFSLAITSAGEIGRNKHVDRSAKAHAGLVYSAGIVLAGLALKYAYKSKKKAKSKASGDQPASRLEMNYNSANLEVNGVTENLKKGKKNKVVYDKNAIKTISLFVGNNSSDKTPVKLEMERTTESGSIALVAGKVGDAATSNISLKVGKSQIFISDEGIQFKSPKFSFIDEKDVLLTQINRDGLLLEKGNLDVKKDLNVRGKIVVKGDLSANKIKSSGASMGSPVPPPKPAKPKKIPQKWPTVVIKKGYRSTG